MSTITSVPGAVLAFLCLACTACADIADLAGAQRASPLFDGRDFSSFELVSATATPPAASFSMRDDGVIAASGLPTGYLVTRQSYQNYRLHVEWRWSGKPGNAGVLLHVLGGPKDRAWPLSLQLQTKHGNVGDVLPMAGASFNEPLTSAPGAAVAIKGFTGVDSERPPGQWNSADILSRDGTIEVSINGVAQNRVTGAAPHGGKIGFQLEGTPFEMRNVTILRLQ